MALSKRFKMNYTYSFRDFDVFYIWGFRIIAYGIIALLVRQRNLVTVVDDYGHFSGKSIPYFCQLSQISAEDNNIPFLRIATLPD